MSEPKKSLPIVSMALTVVCVLPAWTGDAPAPRQDWVVEIAGDGLVVARPATDEAVTNESQESVYLVGPNGKLPAIKVSGIEIPLEAQDAVIQRIRQRSAWDHEPAREEGSWTILPSSDGVVTMGQSYTHRRYFAVGVGRCLLVEAGHPKKSLNKASRRELSDKMTEVLKQTISANTAPEGSPGRADGGMKRFEQWLIQKQLEAAVGFMVTEGER